MMTSPVLAANVKGPLPPGKAAGVKQAQLLGENFLLLIGLGVIIGGIILATTGGDNNSSTTTTTAAP
jgi:hypothetical protein